ncbi:hypothetical protein AD933_02995 [Acetobacter malorum]|uniref:Uncharacterized protein n=1 Tax=Acetobacter malorum TaxID=178901 RepID=A0A149RVZ8_9PROT|nr:hypothetical protein [Acetobacter malorum]KXV18619.1 hypothetical protein AD933_02995 [Acetobacter malorum]
MLTTSYRPRIQTFREDIIRTLPKAPNTKQGIEALRAQPTNRLILAFLTWRMRLVPIKPREVRVWASGVSRLEFKAIRPKIRSFLSKVESGQDLKSHLSDLVNTKGVVLPGASQSARGQDIDSVLIRDGLHHFHIGRKEAGNPKGRSGTLIFAEVLEKEFRIVALSNHQAFTIGTPEHLRFFKVCQAYISKDIPEGQAFMSRPVMASGHPADLVQFSDRCAIEIERLEPSLDDPEFMDRLYNSYSVDSSGNAFRRPERPELVWYFEDMKFGFLEKKTNVFFCIFPFYER